MALPQIGTLHIAKQGLEPEQHTAWVQWWIRNDDTATPIALTHPTITPGDDFLCSLSLTSPTNALMVLRTIPADNANPGEIVRIRFNVDGVPNAAAQGASAEWIVERPLDPNPVNKNPHPLAAFDDASHRNRIMFSDCVAEANGREQALQDPDLIRMVEQFGNNTQAIARPLRRGEDQANLAATYIGP